MGESALKKKLLKDYDKTTKPDGKVAGKLIPNKIKIANSANSWTYLVFLSELGIFTHAKFLSMPQKSCKIIPSTIYVTFDLPT